MLIRDKCICNKSVKTHGKINAKLTANMTLEKLNVSPLGQEPGKDNGTHHFYPALPWVLVRARRRGKERKKHTNWLYANMA